MRIANEETSGLAAGIVTEDEAAAERFLDGYRGTAAFWNAPTRFTDGFELTGAPETGINVDWAPGRAGPSPTATSGCGSTASSATGARRDDSRGEAGQRPRRGAGRPRAALAAPCSRAEICRIVRGGEPVCVVSSGAIALGLPQARPGAAAAQRRAAPGCFGARAGAPPGAWEAALAPIPAAQVLLTAADVGDRTAYVNARGAIGALFAARRRPGRERERRDRHGRDHLRRQRRARGPGCRPAARPAARPAHRGRRRLLAQLRHARRGADRRGRTTSGTPFSAIRARWAGAECGARCSPPSLPPRPGSRR